MCRDYDNVAVDRGLHLRWPLTTGVAQGRYYTVHCFTSDGLFVSQRSKLLFNLVGCLCIFSRWTCAMISCVLKQWALLFELFETVRESQLMSPTLKSPPSIMVDDSLFLACQPERSQITKIFPIDDARACLLACVAGHVASWTSDLQDDLSALLARHNSGTAGCLWSFRVRQHCWAWNSRDPVREFYMMKFT